ncbi:hypothetical protein [Ruegeria jejuensis]|uniref:hypothetical protein n=1 Tax=Ruegeria jejuensis TaxID=3233338 RepID=UPI00355BD7A6
MAQELLGLVKSADPDVLEIEISEQLRLLRHDPAFRQDAEEAGIRLEELDALPEDMALFEVEKPANHLGGIAEAILIKIAVNVGTAATIALSTLIWQKVIKPAINKGGRSVEDKTDPADE